MNQKPNPLNRLGRKNIHCPQYGDCLDYAADRYWEHWDCAECFQKTTRQVVTEVEYTTEEIDVFFHLPARVYRIPQKDELKAEAEGT